MTFTLQQVTSDVLAWLGMAEGCAGASATIHFASDSDIILDKIRVMLPSMGSMIAEASASDIADGIPVGVSPSLTRMPCGLYAAVIPLDPDVIRICAVKMKGWSRPVVSAISMESPASARVMSPEAGIAGSPANPAAYISADKEGVLLIAMGSESASDSLEFLKVWKTPDPSADGRFSFPSRLYPKLISRLADAIGMFRPE